MAAVTVTSDAAQSELCPDRLEAGVVLCRSAKYTAAAALDANSVIQMVPVCDGMMILDIQFSSTALGASRTLDIGDGTDVDLFFDGVDASSACAGDLFNEGDVATCFGKVYTEDDTIDIKVLGDTFPLAAVVTMNVYYKMVDGIDDENDSFS